MLPLKFKLAGLALVMALVSTPFAQPMDEPVVDRPEMNQFFAGAGTSTFDNISADDWAYNFYAGKLWEVNPLIAFKAMAEATTDFDESVIALGSIGANFYPIDAEYAPYIGGNVGLGYGRDATTEDGIGIGLGAQAGLQLFRTANLQVSLEAGMNAILNELAGNTPVSYGARVGILF